MSRKPRFAQIAWRVATALSLFLVVGGRVVAQNAVPKIKVAVPHPADEYGGFPFDLFAYGEENDLLTARGLLEARLGLYLEHIDRVCTLSTAQKKKLDLAGRGEIKRHFEQVDELGRRCRETTKANAVGPRNPKRYRPILEGLAKLPLAGDQGSFDYAPMFQKVCKGVLGPEQTALHLADRRAARELAHRARVHAVVETLDSLAALNQDQRMKLTKLISDATPSARRLGTSPLEFKIVVAGTVRISEAEIKPLMSALQWQSVGGILGAWKHQGNRFAATLENLPPDPDLDDPPPVASHAQP